MQTPCSPASITFVFRRRRRTFAVKGWHLGMVGVVLPILLAAFLGATAYLVWHDQLLASVMTRQSEMQYAYEDRIASLKSALDQEATRGNVDRLMLETSLRDLALKSERLESRATAIDDVVARMLPGKGTSSSPASPAVPSGAVGDAASPDIAPLRSGDLRLEDHAEAGGGPVGSETTLLSRDRAANVARDIDRLSDRQSRAMAALAGPTIRSVERMSAALAKTGLPFDDYRRPVALGGPFVPLPAEDRGFEQNAALLREATVQKAHLTALIATVPLRKPLVGSLDVTSGFGARLDPFLGRPAMHTGIDLREAWGEAVAATAGGTVTIAGPDRGYGNLVEIDHGKGLRTRYAHLGAITVTEGQKVGAGAVIGRVGSTGRATGPHLHYEVRIDGEPVDPTRFLKAGAELFPS